MKIVKQINICTRTPAIPSYKRINNARACEPFIIGNQNGAMKAICSHQVQAAPVRESHWAREIPDMGKYIIGKLHS